MKKLPLAFLNTVLLFGSVSAYSMNSNQLKVKWIDSELEVGAVNSALWEKAEAVAVGNYWSGKAAPANRHFSARLLWSDTAIYIRFEASRGEPLVINDAPDITAKTIGLWERDVCEVFIAPNIEERNKYFEFEIAPTGEWVDLGINVTPKKRITDIEYKSGMQSAVLVEPEKIVMSIKIEWKAFGKTPKAGDIWLGNVFRCVGKGQSRGYLSWQATNTKTPNFHVPSKFGEFEFVG